jgi:hypothetical protein
MVSPEPPVWCPRNPGTRQGTSSVRISRVSLENIQTKTVDFFLSEEGGSADRTGLSADPGKDFIGDYLRDRIEFVDADGRPLSVNLPFPNPTANANGEFLVQTLVSGATAAQLRIYHLSRLATEIPFVFNDVPSP